MRSYQRQLEREIRKYKRYVAGTQDPETAKANRKKLKEKQHELKNLIDENTQILRRDYSREKVYQNEFDNSGGSGIIKLNRKANRKDKNVGAFSNLQIPIQKRSVLDICQKYNFDTNGLTFKIQRSEKMLAMPFYGSTYYNDIGRIDLLTNAFTNEKQLMRTVIHEKCHVLQLKKYGRKYVQENLMGMEKQAYRFEDLYYAMLKKRV